MDFVKFIVPFIAGHFAGDFAALAAYRLTVWL
jgi:hypothetical protein